MWTGSTGVPPPTGACTGFQWRITNVTGSTVTGDFIATCAGNIPVTGTASGTMTGNNIAWSASGAATAAGVADCRFLLSGTAVMEGDTIRVPYTGSTCLGPVSGTETLRKR